MGDEKAKVEIKTGQKKTEWPHGRLKSKQLGKEVKK